MGGWGGRIRLAEMVGEFIEGKFLVMGDLLPMLQSEVLGVDHVGAWSSGELGDSVDA